MQTLDVLDRAVQASDAAAVAEAALREMLQTALRARMQVGLVVDVTPRVGLDEHLRSVRTIKGADRGTRVFRIDSGPVVEVDPRHPTCAIWTCRAVPISERNGKDMSGATHGANSRSTVTLKGNIFGSWLPAESAPEESIPRDRQRLKDFVESVPSTSDSPT